MIVSLLSFFRRDKFIGDALFSQLFDAVCAILIIAQPRYERTRESDPVRGYGSVGGVSNRTDLRHFFIRDLVAKAHAQLSHAMSHQLFGIFEPDKGVGRDIAKRNEVVFHPVRSRKLAPPTRYLRL